jgi:hypothetical protein
VAAQRVIATSALISVGVGSANSLAKQHKLPSARFLIGSGVAFLALSALAEAEPEVAQALAIAVLSTVLIGQGDGVLSYLNQHGEIDTQKTPGFTPLSTAGQPPTRVNRSALPSGNARTFTVPPAPIGNLIPGLGG